MDRTMIDRYLAGATIPATAIEGLTNEELNAFPVPGTWSIRQIILHLMDSDLIGADRMKRVIAEDQPTVLGYNESLFASHLYYQELDAKLACDVFEKNRLIMGEILKRLPDEAFARIGKHNERGIVTLEYFVKSYVDHLDHHMRFVREKRKLLGKPLAR